MAKKRQTPSTPMENLRATRKKKTAIPVMAGPEEFPTWDARWKEFLGSHGDWWELTNQHRPLYLLRESVVDGLANPISGDSRHRARRAFFTRETAQAEHAFRKCCVGFSPSTVGVWAGSPTRYELLMPANSASISDEVIQMAGWDQGASRKALQGEYDELDSKAVDVVHQKLAYAGWLTACEEYQTDKFALYSQWKKLDSQIGWPLLASTDDQEPVAMLRQEIEKHRTLPDDAQSFLKQANKFMRKWDLCGMVTWDLPLPQGPLEHFPTGPMRHLLGPNHIASAYPKSYDISSKKDIRGEIRDQQRRTAKGEGITLEFPLTDLSSRADTPSKWESVFRLWFIELAVRQRLGQPWGLSSRLIDIFAHTLDYSSDWILQLRKLYRPHL